jgi:acyl-coenzyme A synthetase/AMP-(fatty) acid ligase
MDEALKTARPYCPAATMDAEDPLFLLYTSGSTGKPKVRRRSRCWRPAQALKARCAAFLFCALGTAAAI